MAATVERVPDRVEPVTTGVPTVVLNEEVTVVMDIDTAGARKRTRADRRDGEDSPPTPDGSPDKVVYKKPARGSKPGPKSRKGSA
jgi:hypothetical protein